MSRFQVGDRVRTTQQPRTYATVKETYGSHVVTLKTLRGRVVMRDALLVLVCPRNRNLEEPRMGHTKKCGSCPDQLHCLTRG